LCNNHLTVVMFFVQPVTIQSIYVFVAGVYLF